MIVCFVLPMAAVFLFGYNRLEGIITENIRQIVRNQVSQMGENLMELEDRVSRTSVYISSDMRLNQLMGEYDRSIPADQTYAYNTETPGFMDRYEYLQLSVELQGILVNYADNWLGEEIEMGIIGNDGHIFSTWPGGNTDYEGLDALLKQAKKSGGAYYTGLHDSFVKYQNADQYYTYIKPIYDIHAVDLVLGMLVVTVPVSEMGKIIENYLEWETYGAYLLDREGQLAYTFSEGQMKEPAELLKQEAGREGKVFKDKDGNRYLIQMVTGEGYQWDILCAVPYEEIFTQTISLQHYVFGICATLILILSVITVLVIYRLFAPLRVLRDSMKRVENGEWEVCPLPVASEDDIGSLTAGFNQLVQKLRKMIDREKELEQQKGELKFEMLLAQINPHFLFNTLNSVRWMAAMIHADNITNTIQALGRLLEISMNRQAEILSVDEELRNLESYVEIQSVRYGEQFHVEYVLEDGIKQYQTLKLVFQPIVENAILHNIQEVSPLKILVEGKRDGEDLIFRITDNGIGMDEDTAKKILKSRDTSEKSVFRGIGVSNVHQRIRMKYGERYGLEIFSEKGKGTRVEIRLPAILYQEEEWRNKNAESAHS